ncbi:FKBP-type peptidyl-prolyl cis-trans isomerase [Fusobacterium sp. PH5-44]|uniref:FKBP-type peptidyl-prolyl cis-trans isomerase n=1 Tax=unclassified Fusobacterium TaxID=2648384 RepID=UPI003D1CEA3B
MVVSKDRVIVLNFEVYDASNNELLESTENDMLFSYIQGIGNFVPKIEEALEGKGVGDKVTVEVSMEEGYGEYSEELIVELPKTEFEGFDDIFVGMEFEVELDNGEERDFCITDILEDSIMADGNHPFAGRDLRFEVEIVEVRDATEEELEMGYPEHEHECGDDCCCGHDDSEGGCGCGNH